MDSDVDFLVVMPLSGSRRDKQLEIGVALQRYGLPVDVIVTTPEEFVWRREVPGTLEYPAAREGKVLYARRTPEEIARRGGLSGSVLRHALAEGRVVYERP